MQCAIDWSVKLNVQEKYIKDTLVLDDDCSRNFRYVVAGTKETTTTELYKGKIQSDNAQEIQKQRDDEQWKRE